jgi:hypothetical protein
MPPFLLKLCPGFCLVKSILLSLDDAELVVVEELAAGLGVVLVCGESGFVLTELRHSHGVVDHLFDLLLEWQATIHHFPMSEISQTYDTLTVFRWSVG